MLRASSLGSFAADPVGHYLAAGHCVAWCFAPDLIGAAAWDEPTPEDVDFLAAAWDGVVGADTEPFDKVFDVQHIGRIREDTFERLVSLARERSPTLREVRRQVLIGPSGIGAAVLHGFWSLVPSRHPWHVAQDARAGFEWLGRVPIHEPIAEMLAELRDADPRARLRRWLEDHVVDATLPSAAAALGLSPRTLQRELRGVDSSFRAELRDTRLAISRRLLLEPGAKVDAVAAEIGCDSASTFVRMFREAYDETPAAWRDRVTVSRSGDR